MLAGADRLGPHVLEQHVAPPQDDPKLATGIPVPDYVRNYRRFPPESMENDRR